MFCGKNNGSSSSTTTCDDSNLNMDLEVDERIASLLSSLRLTSLRNKNFQDGDDERLKKIHRQLEWLINEEPDDHRRRRLRHILPAANCVREQVSVLRHYLNNTNIPCSASYATQIHAALTAIMKESFEEEYRKLATVVGILDAVAELLIFEVDAFGIDCPTENRTIRKLIASTLTNLTFGNAQSKRRLCSYPNLIEYVIKIIDDSHSLAQVYAGLLRNLSWMADAQMSATLAPSVPALARASLRAYRAAESKCLCATLSALWNLASHSRDNKKALCEEFGFLETLIELSTNDAQQTALVEPASGILKYASMYLAVVGADQYLSTSSVHMMILRLIDLLNSPSFTIIGNALGVLSQLLAKDHQLRSQLLMNQKAMVLLNHLRNSARDDIRNPVKTVLNYLNSSNVSESYGPPYASPHGALQLGYCLDGMSSSYSGTASAGSSYVDSNRLLKYRSAHSHAANALPSGINNNTSSTDHYPYSPPSCGSIIHRGFAPRPGDRSQHLHHHLQQQQQFASLPRQFFRKNKRSNASSGQSNDAVYFEETVAEARLSPSDFITTSNYSNHSEQKDRSTASTTSGFVFDSSQDLALDLAKERDDSRLSHLSRPDDPSFEVEDSVRCTRCTSTQSLSSLLQGERSAWDSCNNSAADSNRLSPLSDTEIPDSPTQCTSLHDSAILPTHDFVVTSKCNEENRSQDKLSASKEVSLEVSQSDEAPAALDTLKSTTSGESSSNSKNEDAKSSTEQKSSVDDDYGTFMGRADFELLDQSIEAAMPKRVEINEEFLADMIEQAQPKPSPAKHHSGGGGRHFSKASVAKLRSSLSRSKTDDDDFLLQSIASVLPQVSGSRHSPLGGHGQLPKKARAMTGETARSSSGPKRVSHAALSHNRLMRSCSVVRTKELRPNNIALKKSMRFGNKITTSVSTAPFDATLQSSLLVESSKTAEKVRDASDLMQDYINEESNILSKDSYSLLMDTNRFADRNVPQDVDEEFKAEQLTIDCGEVSETVKQTNIKSQQKTNTLRRLEKTQKILKRRSSEQELSQLPTPVSIGASPNSSSIKPGSLITSTPMNSSSLLKKYSGKTSRYPTPVVESARMKALCSIDDGSKNQNLPNIINSVKEPNSGSYQTDFLPRPKQSFIRKPTFTSTALNPAYENSKKCSEVMANIGGGSNLQFENRSAAIKKKTIKQMLITTV